jgi:hypothetical protein
MSRTKEEIKEYKKQYTKNNREKINRYVRQFAIDNPEKFKLWSRKRHLKKTYGVTIEQYQEMLTQQSSGCSICNRTIMETGKPLGIDHNHKTNIVRDLLCNKCNRGLGFFNDNPELLTKAIKYLNKHENN